MNLVPLSSYTGTLYGNTRLYTGREYDRESSLYYNRARYYNPDTGRFMSRDPIGQNDQVNLYTYVANSPLKYVDRMGLEKILIFTGTPRNERDQQLIERTYWYQHRMLLEAGVKGNNIIHVSDAMTPKAVNTGVKPYLGNIKGEIFIMHGEDGQYVGGITLENVGELNSLKVDSNDNPSIFLISCWAGRGGANSIAQKMSNALNSNLTAVDDGKVWVNEGVEDDIPGHPIGQPFPETGNWKNFTPIR